MCFMCFAMQNFELLLRTRHIWRFGTIQLKFFVLSSRNASRPFSRSWLILHQSKVGDVMFQSGRLIGDVLASIGAVLVIAGPGLLAVQYFICFTTSGRHPINIGMIFDALSV